MDMKSDTALNVIRSGTFSNKVSVQFPIPPNNMFGYLYFI